MFKHKIHYMMVSLNKFLPTHQKHSHSTTFLALGKPIPQNYNTQLYIFYMYFMVVTYIEIFLFVINYNILFSIRM